MLRPKPFHRGTANEDMKMAAKSTTLEAAERDLKELMADVTRAVEKAQQAVARITGKATVTAAEGEPTTASN
jgi:hypothetical protein